MTESQNNNYEAQVPVYLFHQGNNARAYEYMGAHRVDDETVVFRTWAPNAVSVSVSGDFNGWNHDANPMIRIDGGCWETEIEGLENYTIYKYSIVRCDGSRVLKCDPYARHFETAPANCSKVYKDDNYKWQDAEWIESAKDKNIYESPVNIYEVHAGSWRKYQDGNNYDYVKLAEELAVYLKKMNYTHVELMPLTEYPFEGSWGYQVTNYFAPTSRYGTPEDFMYFVNTLHKAGIGVILDWVPAHFPRDTFGLAGFDGTCLYEHQDPRNGSHPHWGTLIYNYGRPEVSNFLIANALFWIEHFHIDGLRVDAVASMLYLDYGKKDGEWVANKYGGNQNLEAIEFFKHLNSVILGRNPGTMMIAEESTAWPKVTGKPEDDGLGFSMKWNMGWMHDFTEYMKLDPYFRKGAHYNMTFAMSYAYSENYVLVLSHDEVVHLKCSMLNKMPGLGFDKFANLKAGYAFMMGHSGKKLLFMGQDFAQLQEWSEARELDWYLLGEEWHRNVQEFTKDLLHLYKKNKAMYECDDNWEGFEWINADDADRSIYSFVRHSKDQKKNLLFVCNMTPMARPDYRVGVPKSKQYKLIINSDELKYGGTGQERPLVYKAEKSECDGRPYSFAYDLPPYGVAIFEY